MAAQGGSKDRADIAARRSARRHGLLRRWIGCLVALRRAEDGISAVEFGLATPIFLALMLPVLDLGLAFSQQIRVNMAVQAGAQYVAVHPWNDNSVTDITSVVSGSTTLPVTVTPAPAQTCGCASGTTIGSATCGSTCADGTSAGYYVTVGAELSYSPIVPYSLLAVAGSSTTLSSQAVVRIY